MCTRLRLAALTAALAAIAGCDAPQHYVFGTALPAAALLAQLGWEGPIAFSVASIITVGLPAWLAVRRRASIAGHEPIDRNPGPSWLLVGGFAIPFAIQAFLFVRTVDTTATFPKTEPHGRGPDIIVTGHQWWFQVDYPSTEDPDRHVTTTTEIHIPVGRPMTIQLQSFDVIHSFWIPKLHGKVDIIPGQKNFIRIQADLPGAYLGECAEYCGMQYAHMRMMVVAEPKEQYERWLEHQRADAGDPTDPLAREGERVLLASACPLIGCAPHVRWG
jgi:cytochrome c oxidase subunit 2